MANYRISFNQACDIQRNVNAMCDRYINVMEQEFPLNLEEIQAVTVTPEIREHFKALRALGVDSIQTFNCIGIRLYPSDGVSRAVAIKIWPPQSVFTAFTYQVHDPSIRDLAPNPRIPCDLSVLSEAKHAALVKWIETALMERRRAELTKNTVASFIKAIENPSIGKLMARWPGLKVALKDIGGHSRSTGHYTWQDRARNLPTNLNRWKWPWGGPEAEWYQRNKPAMAIADEILLAASGAPELRNIPGITRANIVAWDKLDKPV